VAYLRESSQSAPHIVARRLTFLRIIGHNIVKKYPQNRSKNALLKGEYRLQINPAIGRTRRKWRAQQPIRLPEERRRQNPHRSR